MSDEPRITGAIQEATTRHRTIAQHLSDLLAPDYPGDILPYLNAVLADIPVMAALISRQGTDLALARLKRANLAAAGLAVINGVPIEVIADLAGHASTAVTETVYRHQLKPVITRGAATMNTIFTEDAETKSA